jgi:hypothetical protein
MSPHLDPILELIKERNAMMHERDEALEKIKLAEYWTWKANQRLASAICERDEARAMCPNGIWGSDADYQRLHTAASRLLTKVNAAIPPGFFQQIEGEYDALQDALYGREVK